MRSLGGGELPLLDLVEAEAVSGEANVVGDVLALEGDLVGLDDHPLHQEWDEPEQNEPGKGCPGPEHGGPAEISPQRVAREPFRRTSAHAGVKGQQAERDGRERGQTVAGQPRVDVRPAGPRHDTPL